METTTALREIPLARITPSATNPRKYFDAETLGELAADIKLRGLLQPVLLRPAGDDFELVFGERRFRAVQLAGLDTITAMVRELSDRDVLETQLVENAKREDIHPLEEADALAALHAAPHALSVEDLAGRIGRPRAHVRARLQLLALAPAARKSFDAGTINLGVAQLLARVPDAELQAKALDEVTRKNWRNGAMTVGEAADHLAQHFMLRLDGAPFDLADATLDPAAGPCTTCRHRTGNQPELFGDVKSKDTCTNPPCFTRKRDAVWQIRTAKVKADGGTVVAAKEAKDLFPWGDELRSPKFVDLAAKCFDDPKHRTYAQLLKKSPPPVALARDQRGGIHDLVSAADLTKALKANGHEFKHAPVRSSGITAAESRSARERKDREAREREVLRAATEQIVAAAGRRDPADAFWRIVARGMIEGIWHDSATKIVARRGLAAPATKGSAAARPTELLTTAADTLAGGELRGLVLELATVRYASTGTYEGANGASSGPSAFAQACALFKVDLKKLDAEAKAAAGAAKKPTPKKGKGAARG